MATDNVASTGRSPAEVTLSGKKWRKLASSRWNPLEIQPQQPGFTAELQLADLGASNLTSVGHAACRVYRSLTGIRKSDADSVVYPQRGGGTVRRPSVGALNGRPAGARRLLLERSAIRVAFWGCDRSHCAADAARSDRVDSRTIGCRQRARHIPRRWPGVRACALVGRVPGSGSSHPWYAGAAAPCRGRATVVVAG